MEKKQIEKILIITLTNIGDVVLTIPVINVLSKNFSNASISIMCSKKARELFLKDPRINTVIEYNKHSSLFDKFKLSLKLRQKNFDIVVDLRHTLFPLLLNSKYKTNMKIDKEKDLHKREFHLNRLKEINLDIDFSHDYPYIFIPDSVKKQVDNIMKDMEIGGSEYIVLSPGGKDDSKLWSREKFLALCKKVIKNYNYKILLTGDKNDICITEWIMDNINDNNIFNMAGKTHLLQLAELLKRAKALVTNDSGSLHIGNAVGVPVVSIFGPTNELNYGPLGENDVVITDNISCRPCVYARCKQDILCLKNINVSDVYNALVRIINE